MSDPANTTVPQNQFYDDQEIFSLDFDQLYDAFITPIDALRSHFNALNVNSQELNTPQYQESRCHTFYRMIGFPIVAFNSTFHSPGFDPNLNMDASSIANYQKIDSAIISDNDLTIMFKNREQVFKDYAKIFSTGGVVSQSVALGSIFIRSFSKQFSETDPLINDPSQTQIIDERQSEILDFYTAQASTNDLTNITLALHSRHLLKPFIVDPRVDSSIRPTKNRLCAPFLKDKSQTKIFQSTQGSSENLKRPFIERVISVRFNNKNVTTNQGYINKIINDIKNSDATDTDLLNTASNALGQLHDNEIVIFNNYYKIVRIIIDKLTTSIRDIQHIRQNINFDPIPSSKNGVEDGNDGGLLAALDPNDDNNQLLEENIIFLSQKNALNSIILDAGIQGVSDPGDFAFSNLDDTVFSINKNVQQSYDNNIDQLTGHRTQLGSQGIDDLRNIEIIMGEFSGIGLIDMVAIQAALWIMPSSSLLGLIDDRSYQRLLNFRSDINTADITRNGSVTASLTDFEATLKTIYQLIQDYYDNVNNGTSFSV